MMLVRDLIAQLRKLDSVAEVKVWDGADYHAIDFLLEKEGRVEIVVDDLEENA